MKKFAIVLPVLALALPTWAQDRAEERRLAFTSRFKEASVDAVLQYVSSETGWIFVQEKAITGRVNAVSDTEIPVSKVLEFLDSVLRRHGMVTYNPHHPSLPQPGQIVKIIVVDEARRTTEIYTGSNPDEIPISDRVRTQIIPLKAATVGEVQKELGELLRKAIEPDGHMAISSYSNSIILTGRSDGINRAARILRVIDVSPSAGLQIRVFALKNANADETVKVLNEVFKRESIRPDAGPPNLMSAFLRRLSGPGVQPGTGTDQGPQPRTPAGEMVRITADARTNSVIVSATKDNMRVIKDLILKLDDKGASAIKFNLYELRYGDATATAKIIEEMFARTTIPSAEPRRGNRLGNATGPAWMNQPVPTDEVPASTEVRAIADLRTNSVIVAASEHNLRLIDELVNRLDRPVHDILEVKIYKLVNADPTEMSKLLQALFRPQIQTSPQYERNRDNPPGIRYGRIAPSAPGALPPSHEVEITPDVRTRSVVVKASRGYISVIEEVIRELDADMTETSRLYVVPLINHTASDLAATLQNLMNGNRSGQRSSPSGAYGDQLFNAQNQGPSSPRSSRIRSASERSNRPGR